MSTKVSFASLGLKIDDAVKEVEIQENVKVNVKQYLSVSDKNDLIYITLQKAEENGIYNDFLLDVFFHLNLIYSYTNLSFTDKQRENEFKIYDMLNYNGIIDKVVAAIPEDEYKELWDAIDNIKKDTLTYKNTAGAVLQSVINDLPRNAAAAKEIVESWSPEKFAQIKSLTETAVAAGINNNPNDKVIAFNPGSESN